MFEMINIDHVGIRVADLKTARGFYEKLGFEFVAGPIGPEPVAIMKHPCGVVINFILNAVCSPKENILMDVEERHAGYTHIALGVVDLLEVKNHMDKNNIIITEGPLNFGEGLGASLFIRDQDKNVIEFHQAASLLE